MIRVFPLLLGMMVVAGCANVPLKYSPSSLVGNYSGMTAKYDLDKVRIDPSANVSAYDTIVISPIDRSHMLNSDLIGSEMKEVLDYMTKKFRSEMAEHFSVVASNESELGKEAKAVRLDLAVTELIGTDVMMNLMIGFGSGNATATLEGRLVDLQTGKELVAFADRKKGSGLTKKEWQDQSHSFLPASHKRLKYLLLFCETWAENVGNIIESLKK